MAVRLRLARVGRRKLPAYRIVAADQRKPRDGRFIEILGRYQPTNPNPEERLVLNTDSALDWLKKGAQPTETVHSLLRKSGVMKTYHEHKIESAKARKAASNS